ncbi:hypothetical protein B9Z19DRAFT_1065405 [Tuber borchii]|uniref:DUF6536 domain-containing protein n=1 Tax=Tuber borchii TaxID=42251 RepID=A0A2T6ZR73_TUBBO|nr:hypothetical protein B9Z19DRAFT_1065405 [Tuber borchii]
MAAVLLGGNSYDRGAGGGGSQYSPRESSTLDSEFIQEQSKSFFSEWKPVWCTGWHPGVLACATSAVVVLFINVGLATYAATNPENQMGRGVRTLYSGSCDKSKTIGLWSHLGINALSTLLLSGSNYTQQWLAAPTRSEIDAAHARRRWVDIGVPSVRNLFWIKPERTLLWIAIGLTSIPLHLLYNSAVFTSLGVNSFAVTVVTSDHFEPGAYSNLTEGMSDWGESWNPPKRYNANSSAYKDLNPSECMKLYNTDYVSSYGNLFLITQHSSNTTHNNTLLDMTYVVGYQLSSNSWLCSDYLVGDIGRVPAAPCNPSKLISKVISGLPWSIKLATGEEVEIRGCKSERTAEKCKVQFSLEIMMVVICCNLVKACCMVIAVIRSREPTLVTLGDAVDSFLRVPDPTTMGICFADRQFIKREWRHGWKTGPRQWKQERAKRWWTSVSKTRWIICNFFCLIIVIAAGVSLRLGLDHEGKYWNTDFKSIISQFWADSIINITQVILLVNLPQTILSFLYLTYNSLFTCMLMGHEWSLFSHSHRTLRVTSPRSGQRSTYWLQMPYTYAIPLMALSALLHWLTSQSLFLVLIERLGLSEEGTLPMLPGLGYSCIAIIFVLTLGILALVTAAWVGSKQFSAEITTVGSCSAAISAACHASESHPEEIVGKKIRWGDVGSTPYLGIRHLTFSSEEGVRKPVFGETYLGSRLEKE